MKLTVLKTLIIAGAALATTSALAQDGGAYVNFNSQSSDTATRSGAYGGKKGYEDQLCWRTGYWTPAQAIAACDPDLVKAPEPAPAPVAAPVEEPVMAPAVAPAPVPAVPTVQKISLESKVLFEFAKSDLRDEGKEVLNREIVEKLPQFTNVELVLITGYADRIGSDASNQALSERRAESIRAYLVANGLKADQIESLGAGEANPVTGDTCQQTNRQALINCLSPDRRVDIEISGQAAQ
jgi:OOP family OmpA-OmpF porin